MTQALLEGLRERGYVVGRNLQIEYRYSQGRTEQIPALVAELVAFGPEVIVAATRKTRSRSTPLLRRFRSFSSAVADPVAVGLVESLAHPGGNVTGFATLVPEGFVGKQLQFLKDLVPQASRIAVLINPTNPIHQRERPKLPEIGRLLGVELVVVEASKPDQLETAFETAHTQGAEAIHVFGDPLIFTSLGEGRGARRSLSIAGDVLGSAECTGRRTYVLWSEPTSTSGVALAPTWTKSSRARDLAICRSSSRPDSI